MPKILVVDDHADTARVLARLLRLRGYDASVATDGPAALAALAAGPADLVILDQMMPGMEGLDVLRAMRAMPGLAGVPVVMFSAADAAVLRPRALAAGARDLIPKAHLRLDDLLSVVARYAGPPS